MGVTKCVPSPVSLEPVVKCGVSDFTSMVCISEPAVAPPQPLCSSSAFHLLKTLMTNQRRACSKNHSEMLTHHPEVRLLIKSYRQKRSSLSLPSSESACNKIVFVTTSLKRLQSPLLTQTIAEDRDSTVAPLGMWVACASWRLSADKLLYPSKTTTDKQLLWSLRPA